MGRSQEVKPNLLETSILEREASTKGQKISKEQLTDEIDSSRWGIMTVGIHSLGVVAGTPYDKGAIPRGAMGVALWAEGW